MTSKNEKDDDLSKPSTSRDLPKDWQFNKSHFQDQVIDEISKVVSTSYTFKDSNFNLAFVSQIEPKILIKL